MTQAIIYYTCVHGVLLQYHAYMHSTHNRVNDFILKSGVITNNSKINKVKVVSIECRGNAQ